MGLRKVKEPAFELPPRCDVISVFVYFVASTVSAAVAMIFLWLQKNLVGVSVIVLTITFITAIITVTDIHSYQNSSLDLWVNVDSIKGNVSQNFLSVAIDSRFLASGKMMNIIRSPDMIRLAKYLSPGYLRIGGNDADLVIFQENGSKELSSLQQDFDDFNLDDCYGWDTPERCPTPRNVREVIMTGEEWLAINDAARAAGLALIFDLNVLLRTSSGYWNSSNAKELLSFSVKNNITAVWQLGNEPDGFYHKFGVKLSARQLGNDFNTLKKILQREKFSSEPLLVGPDVTRPKDCLLKGKSTSFLEDFLRISGKSLDAVTWHQYYFSGKTAQLTDFIDTNHFDILSKQIREVKNIVASATLKKLHIWISETSSAYSGGAPGLSDRFIASFLWLDKLGVAARDGINIVVKQSLIGGYYGLIEEDTLKPLPTWWVSLLYKELVGTEVLRVFAPLAPSEFRIYGHRSAKSVNDDVLFGVNFINKETKLKIFNNCTKSHRMEKYILTAPDGDLTSKSILLNDKLLRLNPDGSLPPLRPQTTTSEYLTLPPYSLMFTVLKKSNNDC